MGHLRFEQTSDSVKACVGILAACICTCGMAADFAFLPCNRPDGTEWLKVSLGASPAVVDYDGDGDLDLVASSGWQTPRAGTYFFETGYAVDATYTTSCAPPPMMEDLGLGSVAIARPASL